MELTLRQIRYFVATAESGQVSRAAELCNITQSSITLAITALENTLGYKLFVRQSRGMQLTAQGEKFLRHCHAILRTVEDAVEPDPAQPSDVSGSIRLAVTGTIAAYVFPPVWRKMNREFPGITLEVTEVEYADMETGLKDGTFDMAMMLTSNIQQSDSFHYEELIRSPRRLWVSSRNPLANREEISLKDLQELDYIVPTMDDHEPMIRRYWDKYNFKPRILFKTHYLEALRSMIANDLGIAILSDMVYRSLSLEGRRIVKRDIVEQPPSSDVGIAWLKTADHTPPQETFLSFLKSETSDAW
ncbi:LysR family transcriptional regulator [Pacificispira sp.]|uniref:LysR family transcriptional regulator n=1 Tax=Pacificispira sp. TaxID=2888761 RepID=UPI002EAC79D0|nr:LysR family transcriptional regulator [Pseudomonadota bacterium]